MQQSPEDQADTVDIGPVKGIPVFHDDDPRLEDERALWSAATRVAQALHSVDDLLHGVRHPDWRVRHESVPRLVARGKEDGRTLSALVTVATDDDAWQVRDAAVSSLVEFHSREALTALHRACRDAHPEVRWSAEYALSQLGSE